MKKCSKCNVLKSEDKFSYKNKSKNIRRASCKKCQRKQDNKYYRSNSERRKQIKKDRKRNKEEKVEFLNSYKKKCCCENCGEKRYYLLQFHHQQDKEKGVSDMAFKGYSISRIKEEIRKCKVLCANCHIELHHFKED